TGYGELANVTKNYLRSGLEQSPAAAEPKRWSSIARRIAGCRGMPPNARLRWATRTSYGTPPEATAGRGLPANADAADGGPPRPQSRDCWIARPNANRRRSMSAGTSQT